MLLSSNEVYPATQSLRPWKTSDIEFISPSHNYSNNNAVSILRLRERQVKYNIKNNILKED